MCIRDSLNLFVNLSDEAAGAEIMVEKTNDDKEKALETVSYTHLGVCRVCFRELAYKGEIPGVKKASW